MKIELKEITVRELTEGYEDNEEKGVRRTAKCCAKKKTDVNRENNF